MRFILFPVLVVFLFACSNSAKYDKVLITKVKKGDFIYKLETSGTVEAANNLNIECPRVWSDVTVQKLVPEGEIVNTGDTVCILTSRSVEANYKDAIKEAELARVEYNKSEASLALQCLLLESQAQAIDAETKIKKLDSVQSMFVSEVQKKIVNLQLKKAIIERDKVVNKVAFLKRINASELQKLKLRIQQADNRVTQASERLGKLIIRTTVNGIVQYSLNRWTWKKIHEGDIIWDGVPILTIPNMDKMQVKLTVSESSYKRIENNQKTKMVLDAFPEINFTGIVIKKAVMGTPISRNSKIKVFDIYVSIDSTNSKIIPGLSVSCKITIKEEKGVLTVPITSIFDEDSSKYVYMAIKNKFLKKKVIIGDINNNEAIILKGLKENELIAQVQPPEKLVIQLK